MSLVQIMHKLYITSNIQATLQSRII